MTLAFFAGVIGLMAFDYPIGSFTIAAIPLLVIVLALGWRILRNTPAHTPVPQTVPSIVLTEDLIDAQPPTQMNNR